MQPIVVDDNGIVRVPIQRRIRQCTRVCIELVVYMLQAELVVYTGHANDAQSTTLLRSGAQD